MFLIRTVTTVMMFIPVIPVTAWSNLLPKMLFFWMLKANYYIELMSSFVINLAKFWKAVNINKNKSFIPIPSHVTFNDCLINKTSGICHALNTHFATVGNLLDIVTQALNNKPLAHVPLSSPYRPSLRLRLRRHFKLSIAGKQLERIN